MLTDNDREAIIRAYLGGLRADMLQAQTERGWGAIWTVPSASPEAMERAGRQFTKMRAYTIRHIRRAHLKNAAGQAVNAVIVTAFPGREQVALRLDTSVRIRVEYIGDEAQTALEVNFVPEQPSP